MNILFTIMFVIMSVLFGAFLELNHQTIPGWILTIILLAGFWYVQKNILSAKPFLMRLGAWLLCIAAFALIVYVSRPPMKRVAAGKPSAKKTQVIETADGKVRGIFNEKETVEIFTGIPYAAPPVGDLRWKKPQDPEPWDGIRECDHFAPMSMQSVNLPIVGSLTQIIGYHDYQISLSDNYRPAVSEDSLYLNIWKPAGTQTKLPVVVYIHGGSLQTGQPWYDDYSGEGFAENGVICVNMGYRLGIFGFLADEEMLKEEGTAGNFGLLDQIKALEWVRDNIEAFGGDPDNVTLAGESAGAVCVDALCVSPLAKGLFQRVILESSTVSSPVPPHSYRSFSDALASGKKIREKYSCYSLAELRRLPAEQIVGEMDSQHHITPDGYVFTDDPYVLRKQGIHNEEAILHGFNAEESGPFLLFSKTTLKNYEERIRRYFGDRTEKVLQLYPASTDEEAAKNWAEIYGAVFFNYSHQCLNRLAVENGIPVYEYLFTKTNRRLSCWHSGELVYAFHRIPEKSRLYDAADRTLSDQMHAYWCAFAKTGSPSVSGLPDFAENTSSSRMMRFGDTVEMIDEPYLKLYEILDETGD
ncbi:MAG: carboxylesterase family protein [Solobacterium sp.]|nr:carboxylesterase family protein [Solobacterium sp.]